MNINGWYHKNLIDIIIHCSISVFRGPSLSENENIESPEIRIRKWLTDFYINDAETSDFDKDNALEEEEKREDLKYKRKNNSSCIDV